MTDNDATRSADDCYKGRAAVLKDSYSKPYLIESRTIAGDVGPLDVLVHIHYSGVCYGDLHSRDGGPPAPSQPLRPLVGGHEGVGVVVELGIAAGEVSNIKVGDVVGLGWRHSSCGKCRLCLEQARSCLMSEADPHQRQNTLLRQHRTSFAFLTTSTLHQLHPYCAAGELL
jgi:Zn-dependent alcohol dehydrogenase